MSSDPRQIFGAEDMAGAYRTRLEPVIFRPWAELLLDVAGVQPGQHVLDVASGTGVVARAAAARVGASGSVIASDVSAAMLSHVLEDAPAGAHITTIECSVTQLDVPDEAVDVVVCQQGMQFFPDKPAALGELRRVLKPGGTIAFSVWLAGVTLHPFGIYGDVLEAEGVEAPFPNAFDQDNFTMSLDRALDLLEEAGFSRVEASTDDLEIDWSGPEAVVNGIMGTPFAACVTALPPDRQAAVLAALTEAFTDVNGNVAEPITSAVLARANK